MALAVLMSLALLGSPQPVAFKIAQADPSGPMQTGKSADDEIRADAAAAGDPFPAGAPTDDYGFVAWCEGALSGHMALRARVWPEVERIERAFPNPESPVEKELAAYEEQRKDGEKAMKLLDRALEKGEARGLNNGLDRDAAIARGAAIWNGADTAETRNVAQLWMSWALPQRCETTAARLAK
ncbi:MAG: hypothetical protein ACXW3D_02725 [Caulobacteraceae bacterium]